MSTKGFSIQVMDDYESISAEACRRIVDAIQGKAHLVLCLPTGSTPTRLYEMLAEKYRAGEFKSDKIIAVKLDEWVGMPMNDPATCESYLKNHVIWPLEIPDKHYLAFNSAANNPKSECTHIKNTLDNLGMIDICILGLGLNGHIALNEPSDELEQRPHVVTLSESTRTHAMLKDSPAVSYGMTLGMEDILGSKKILVLVSGAHKYEQLQRLAHGQITPGFPASYLRHHQNALVLADRAAAGK